MNCGVIFGIIIVAAIVGLIVKRATYKENNEAMQKAINRIPNFTATQFTIGSNNLTAIAVDQTQKRICLLTKSDTIANRVFHYKDVISVELTEDGDSITKTSRGSQIGGALAGSLLLGGVGAAVGGLSGSKRTSTKIREVILRVAINNPYLPLHEVKFLDFEVDKKSSLYQNAIKEARHWHAILEIFIKEADRDCQQNKISQAEPPEKQPNSHASVADELQKLAGLLNAGILTDEEFHAEKQKLLCRK